MNALWKPSDEQIKKSNLYDFIQKVNQRYKLSLKEYSGLHQWSIDNPEHFWTTCAEYCGLNFDTPPTLAIKKAKTRKERHST